LAEFKEVALEAIKGHETVAAASPDGLVLRRRKIARREQCDTDADGKIGVSLTDTGRPQVAPPTRAPEDSWPILLLAGRLSCDA
jgi:hypothetical protein